MLNTKTNPYYLVGVDGNSNTILAKEIINYLTSKILLINKSGIEVTELKIIVLTSDNKLITNTEPIDLIEDGKDTVQYILEQYYILFGRIDNITTSTKHVKLNNTLSNHMELYLHSCLLRCHSKLNIF